MFQWMTVITILVLVPMVMGLQLSARFHPNCKLSGRWKDIQTPDTLHAKINTPRESSKDVHEIAVIYCIGDSHYVGSGVYNGSCNVGARVNLALQGYRKNITGGMICHNDKLYYEGTHPSVKKKKTVIFSRVLDDEALVQETFPEPQEYYLNKTLSSDDINRVSSKGLTKAFSDQMIPTAEKHHWFTDSTTYSSTNLDESTDSTTHSSTNLDESTDSTTHSSTNLDESTDSTTHSSTNLDESTDSTTHSSTNLDESTNGIPKTPLDLSLVIGNYDLVCKCSIVKRIKSSEP